MKSYNRWLARVQDTKTPWTESEIIYFRKAIGFCGIQDPALRKELVRLFYTNRGGYRITRQHDVKGQAYMLSESLKGDGERRKGCRLADSDIKILKELDYHLFIALQPQVTGLGETVGYLPIYRAVSIGGDWFEYVGHMYEMVKVKARSADMEYPKLRAVKGGK